MQDTIRADAGKVDATTVEHHTHQTYAVIIADDPGDTRRTTTTVVANRPDSAPGAVGFSRDDRVADEPGPPRADVVNAYLTDLSQSLLGAYRDDGVTAPAPAVARVIINGKPRADHVYDGLIARLNGSSVQSSPLWISSISVAQCSPTPFIHLESSVTQYYVQNPLVQVVQNSSTQVPANNR